MRRPEPGRGVGVTEAMQQETPGQGPEWMRRQERGNAFWLGVMRWISLRCGRRPARVLLPFIALYFTLAAGAARRASAGFLGRCLQRRAGLLDVYRTFLCFAAAVHDRIYVLAGRRDLFDLQIHGGEQLPAAVPAGGGVFLLGAHLGSFEMLRAAALERPQQRVYMAMFSENARRVNQMLAAIDPEAPRAIIELGRVDSMLVVHERLQEGAMVGVLADRASGADTFHRVAFLGTPAPFPSGPFRMAVLMRRPVYFMAALYRGGNRYELHIEPLGDLSQPFADRRAAERELLERYVAVLERLCRAAPHNWFNFYDFWSAADGSPVP